LRRLQLVCLLAAAVLVGACNSPAGGGASNPHSGRVIKFGAILSLTNAGSVYGLQSRDGMNLAVKQINSSGGVNGATLQVSYSDDASDASRSNHIVQRLIASEQDLALLGPTLAESAAAVDPLAESMKTPILAVSSTGIHVVPDCSWTVANPDTTPCKYVFRDSLGEQTAIPDNIMSYARDAHPKTGVLLVAQDEKLSSDDGQIVQDVVSRYGIQLLQVIRFYKNEADLSPYVATAVRLKPNVMFIASPGAIAAKIMNAARALGWTGEFLGGNGFNSADVSRQAGAAGQGARSASAWNIGSTFPLNADFVAAYRAEYKQDPDQLAAQGYTAIEILADAAKRANLTFNDLAKDRDRLRAAMESVKIETPFGLFQFTPAHDVKQTVWIVEMDGHGGFTLLHQIEPT
jgi:branched-chain amino acid transport system substrate-binding protein